MRCMTYPFRVANHSHVPFCDLSSLARVLVVACGLVVSVPAGAQSRSPCEASLATAQTLYRNQSFDDAEALLRECLSRPDLDEETTLQSMRLLALIHLREDNLVEAKQMILRMLAVSFAYQPDPIQDPPTYVALVEAIREQLRVDQTAEAAPQPDSMRVPPEEPAREIDPVDATAPEDAPAEDEAGPPEEVTPFPPVRSTLPPPDPRHYRNPYRRAGDRDLSLVLGVGSYRGEFSTTGSGPLSDFFENSGFSAEIQGGYSLSPSFAAVFSYRFVDLPALVGDRAEESLVTDGGAPVHAFALLSRLQLWPRSSDSPYVQFGVAGAVRSAGGQARAGFGPQAGLGLDIILTPSFGLFAAFDAVLLYPGDVLDQVGASGDFLLFTGVGVRYRTGG